MTTPAEELRAAAAKLRELASILESPEHPGLPWHVEECADEERGDCPCIVAQGRTSYHDEPSTAMFYVADAETTECAAYIAAMGPTVGLALADWLDSTAATIEAVLRKHEDAADETSHWVAPALAVARALNGGQS